MILPTHLNDKLSEGDFLKPYDIDIARILLGSYNYLLEHILDEENLFKTLFLFNDFEKCFMQFQAKFFSGNDVLIRW